MSSTVLSLSSFYCTRCLDSACWHHNFTSMAQNAYTYSQPGMTTQYDPRSQPYPYQAYPRQQPHLPQQQVYGQAQAAAAYAYAPPSYAGNVHAGTAGPALRSPLPAPPTPMSASYGHPQAYTPQPAYSPQVSYAPSSFDQRGALSRFQTPSPVSGRRPLPEPGRAVRSNSVSHHPLPQPAPSPGPRAPVHRPTLSVSSIPTPPARPLSPSSPQAPPPKTTTAVSPPRPLPQPSLPRSVGQPNLARNTSPTKSTFSDAPNATPRSSTQPAGSISTPTPTRPIPESVLPPAVPSGQKFVPHWKRALPTPGQQSPQIERRSTVTGSGSTPPSSIRPLPQSPSTHARAQSSQQPPRQPVTQTNSPPRKLPQPNVRPLTRSPSPSRPTRADSIGSSDDDDIAGSALLSRPQDWPSRSSPQYGIRDLPAQIRASPSKDSQKSASSRLAELSLNDGEGDEQPGFRPPSRHGHSQSVPTVSSQQQQPPQASPVARRWPAGLPHLPRAPAALESLDDAPPPSLRRSPSPIRQAPTSPLRGARRPSIRTKELSRTRPAATSPEVQRTPVDSPADATPPPSGMSDSSVFTLSAFPRPPSFAQPRQPIASPAPVAAKSPPARPSHHSADSSSSVFTLSAFPQPPPPVVVEPPPRKESLGRTLNNRTPVPLAKDVPSRDGSRMRQQVSFPANADSDSDRDSVAPTVPTISINVSGTDDDDVGGPIINISGADDDAPGLPSISIGGADDDSSVPSISIGGLSGSPRKTKVNSRSPLERVIRKGPGLTCGGCGGAIVGRTVYAMGAKWHPGCFRCCVCNEPLENLSSYEHEGRAYCNLDYHEVRVFLLIPRPCFF